MTQSQDIVLNKEGLDKVYVHAWTRVDSNAYVQLCPLGDKSNMDSLVGDRGVHRVLLPRDGDARILQYCS
jgi:hypothetical protein